MQFDTFFTGINAERPAWNECYAYITLLRAMRYNDAGDLETWRRWSGAETLEVITPETILLSHINVLSKGPNAIVAFEGTREAAQLISQVMNANPVPDPRSDSRASSFFKWALDQNYGRITGYLNQLAGLQRVIVTGHSLGGAMGQIFSRRLKKAGQFQVSAFYSFGQPRTFATSDGSQHDVPTFRIINATDPIPGLPPEIAGEILAPWNSHFSFRALGYIETHRAWIVDDGGLVGHRHNLWTNEIIPQVPAWLLDPAPWGDVVQQNHIARIYVDNMRRLAGPLVAWEDFAPLRAINNRIDRFEFNPTPAVPPLIALPSPGTFAHPDTTFPDGPGVPEPPAGSLGTTIEQRSVSTHLFLFGGPDTVAKTFKSRDRRILQKLSTLLSAVVGRDARVAVPKKTSTLSNRILMFPPGGESELGQKLLDVQLQVETLLAQENE